MPFGGAVASKRVIPVISFEAVESQQLPGIALDRMCRRPNFNRAPRGWGPDYCPESNELWREADRLKEAKDWNSGLWSLFSSYKDEPSVNPKAPQGRRRRKKSTPAWYTKWFSTAEWIDELRRTPKFITHSVKSRTMLPQADQSYLLFLFVTSSSIWSHQCLNVCLPSPFPSLCSFTSSLLIRSCQTPLYK